MDPNALIADVIASGAITRTQATDYYEWRRKGGYAVRVELHPATDAWMSGDRYGTVESLGRVYMIVRCDRSGRLRRIRPADLAGTVG